MISHRIIAGHTIPTQMIYQKRRTLSMRFLKDVLVIKVPFGADPLKVEAWLIKKEAWILKAQQASHLRILPPHQRYLFNQVCELRYQLGTTCSYQLDAPVLWITHPKRMSETRAVKTIQHQLALDFIMPIFAKACSNVHLRPQSIQIKDLKSSWGRCSSHQVITLSQRLIECDPQFIYYVCVHELIHLKELNHSPVFWAQVKLFVPNLKHIKTLTPYHVRTKL